MDIVILLGAPGAGKGTVAARLVEPLKATHVSTGAMLREALAKGSPAGLAAKKYMESGELVPDRVIADMVGELLAASPGDSTFILDGFPRTTAQAEMLEVLAAKNNTSVSRAICLDISEDELQRRLGGRRVCGKCGATFHVTNMPPKKEGVCDACGGELVIRADDQPGTIKHRLSVYAEQTAPLVKWYDDKGLLRRIDCNRSTDEVMAAVMAAIRG